MKRSHKRSRYLADLRFAVCCAVLALLFLPVQRNYAQDVLPGCPRLQKTAFDYDTLRIYGQRTDTLPIPLITLPAAFRQLGGNELIDSVGILKPFWEKLRMLRLGIAVDTVRIVHVGDSHIRGHIFPETTARGMTPFVEQTRYSPDAAKHALANNPFSGQLFDGEIIHASGLNAGVPLSAINHGRPLVLIDACEETPTFDTVNFPNEDGARAAVQHLIECGCHRIAIVGDGYSPRTELAHVESSSGLRLRGASGALLDAGLPYDESTNFIGYGSDSGIEAGHAIAEAMLEARAQSADDTAESRSPGTTRATGSTPAIDGIFCINDYAAFGVIRGLADYGIRVPDDVRVIGFDGATAGSYTTPTLSTVQVDLDQLAQFALDMITRRVEQRDQGDGRSDESAGMPATRATIGYTLVPRESTVGSANR